MTLRPRSKSSPVLAALLAGVLAAAVRSISRTMSAEYPSENAAVKMCFPPGNAFR
ncbi:MAG: hypothetical protein LBQ21_04770 [Clostridiales Family XIII bacterium]|nr:hypothetical protein [Clostridiales Family XIII bacterium]